MQTYTIPTASGTMVTHIPPIDQSSTERWAESLIERAEAVIQHGFGLCHDGTPYDAENFLDDMAGDMPWTSGPFRALQKACHAHPRYRQTVNAWAAKYEGKWGV